MQVRYADILFTLGGASNYRLARSYYAKAVEASAGRSVRALYGILACYNSLAEKVRLRRHAGFMLGIVRISC